MNQDPLLNVLQNLKCIESFLVYGISGSGKTTQAQHLARWIREKLGKVLRLASMSGGGWSSINPAVKLGLVKPWYMRARKEDVVELIDRATQGWWPENPADPRSRMLPPEEQRDWDEVGGIMYDSVSEGCVWMKAYLQHKEAAGKIKISAQPIKYKDGDTIYGSGSMAHYGNVQDRMAEFVAQSKAIPNRYILWTALELKATDDNTRLPIYGPDIIGKAKTPEAPAWFDNTLHMYITGQGGLKKGKEVHRLYTCTHFEDDQIPYLAKNRGHYYSPIDEYFEGENANVYKFLEELEKSHEVAEKQLAGELEVK